MLEYNDPNDISSEMSFSSKYIYCSHLPRKIQLTFDLTFSDLTGPVWLNGWVSVYVLSGCGFESRCSHLSFLRTFRAFFKRANKTNFFGREESDIHITFVRKDIEKMSAGK